MNRAMNLLTNEGAPITGGAKDMLDAPGIIQAAVTGTGAVAATVEVEVLNIDGHWLPLGTITLSGTTSATGGFAYGARSLLVRARLTSISGAGAAVTCVIAS